MTGRGNARTFIVVGMVLIAVPAFFLGPSPLVAPLLAHVPTSLVVGLAFALLGVGEGFAMSPLMEDMMASCGSHATEYVDSLSAVMCATGMA
jgi:hypothetical protein